MTTINIDSIHSNNVLNTFSPVKKSQGSDFKNELSRALESLNNSQTEVTEKQKQFVNGEIEAHELTSAVAESQLSLKLATSISSKLVSSLQELTNIQI